MAEAALSETVARLDRNLTELAERVESISAAVAPSAVPAWKTMSFWIPIVLAAGAVWGINDRIADAKSAVVQLDARLTPAVTRLSDQISALDKRTAVDEALGAASRR